MERGSITLKEILKGNEVVLSCPLQGLKDPEYKVQWQKDGFGFGFDPHLPAYPRHRSNKAKR